MEVDTCKKGSVTEIFGFVSTEVREKDLLCIAIISHNSSRLQRKACCRMTKEKFLFFFFYFLGKTIHLIQQRLKMKHPSIYCGQR